MRTNDTRSTPEAVEHERAEQPTNLEAYGIESTDPLAESLENLLDDVHDVDDTFTDRDPEIALALAKCKKEINRAIDIRVDELEAGVSE